MDESRKCPNCGQYKVQHLNFLTLLVIAAALSGILLITLPLEIIILPITIVAFFMPSARKKHAWCTNCHWTDWKKSIPPAN